MISKNNFLSWNKCGFYVNNIQDSELTIILTRVFSNLRMKHVSEFHIKIKKVKGSNNIFKWIGF